MVREEEGAEVKIELSGFDADGNPAVDIVEVPDDGTAVTAESVVCEYGVKVKLLEKIPEETKTKHTCSADMGHRK